MCQAKLPVVAMMVWFGLVSPLATRILSAGSWSVTVRGGDVEMGETPLLVGVPAALPTGLYRLEAKSGSEPVLGQVFQEGDQQFLATVLPHVPAGRSNDYALNPVLTPFSEPGDGLRLRASGQNLIVELDRRLLTEYRIDAGTKPIFFPLIGPTGAPYTRAYPMETIPGEDHDHPHQRSCWFTYGNLNGVDFWAEGKNTGIIREARRKVVAEGPLVVRLETWNDWLGPDQKRICSDERTVTFYRTKQTRVIDFAFTVRASDGPVEFRDTKEGMFGLRVASTMDATKKPGGKITNAEGLTNDKAWGQPSPWVDYVGPVDGKTVGVMILNHPDSFRYPTAWHVRPYGLFAANPFGSHDFGRNERGDHTVASGGAIAFRYRVILHASDTGTAGLPALFAAYARPPAVDVKAQ